MQKVIASNEEFALELRADIDYSVEPWSRPIPEGDLVYAADLSRPISFVDKEEGVEFTFELGENSYDSEWNEWGWILAKDLWGYDYAAAARVQNGPYLESDPKGSSFLIHGFEKDTESQGIELTGLNLFDAYHGYTTEAERLEAEKQFDYDFNYDGLAGSAELSSQLSIEGEYSTVWRTQKLYSSQDGQSGQIKGVSVADFDNDGDLDIAFGDGSAVKILLNEDGDSWAQGLTFELSYPRINDIVAADIDNDGSIDLAVTGNVTNIIFLDENGGLDSSVVLSAYGYDELQVGDINNDGNVDIVTAGRVSSFLNHGERVFTLAQELNADNLITEGIPAEYSTEGLQSPSNILLFDVNHDGFDDIVTGSSNNSWNVYPLRIETIYGEGDGTFQQRKIIEVENKSITNIGITDLVHGDFNGDGVEDIVSLNGNHYAGSFIAGSESENDHLFKYLEISNWPSTQTEDFISRSYFSPSEDFSVPDSPWNGVAGDFNKDGSLDLAFTDYRLGQGGVYLMSGDGKGGFVESLEIPVNIVPQGLVTADFNGDGILDFLTTNRGRSDGNIGNIPVAGSLSLALSEPAPPSIELSYELHLGDAGVLSQVSVLGDAVNENANYSLEIDAKSLRDGFEVTSTDITINFDSRLFGELNASDMTIGGALPLANAVQINNEAGTIRIAAASLADLNQGSGISANTPLASINLDFDEEQIKLLEKNEDGSLKINPLSFQITANDQETVFSKTFTDESGLTNREIVSLADLGGGLEVTGQDVTLYEAKVNLTQQGDGLVLGTQRVIGSDASITNLVRSGDTLTTSAEWLNVGNIQASNLSYEAIDNQNASLVSADFSRSNIASGSFIDGVFVQDARESTVLTTDIKITGEAGNVVDLGDGIVSVKADAAGSDSFSNAGKGSSNLITFKGDLNYDGRVSMKDLAYLNAGAARQQLIESTDENGIAVQVASEASYARDVDADFSGKIDLADLSVLDADWGKTLHTGDEQFQGSADVSWSELDNYGAMAWDNDSFKDQNAIEAEDSYVGSLESPTAAGVIGADGNTTANDNDITGTEFQDPLSA